MRCEVLETDSFVSRVLIRVLDEREVERGGRGVRGVEKTAGASTGEFAAFGLP